MLEKGFKFIVLAWASFFHYVLTGLVFFVPIDISHYVLGAPQFFAIVIGAFFLWLWSMGTSYVILKTLEK